MTSTEPDTRPRSGDVTPDSQRARYEARGGETTTIGDEIDSAYEQGRREGSTTTTSSRGSSVRLQSPTLPSVGAPFLVWLLIVSAESFLNEKRPPLPSRLLVGGGVFAVLGMARGETQKAASVFGWALVLATFYTSAVPGKKPGGLRALGIVGDFMSGKYAYSNAPTVADTGLPASSLGPSTTKR